jgi:hypothetical protein
MALSADDKRLLKELFNRCDPREPLQPDDPRYQPIYSGSHCEDPVARLRDRIEWADIESLHLFSGFNGSGKTTELFRLRRELEKKGAIVLYADALDYLNPSEPLDISDMLLILAGAFNDSAKKSHGIDIGSESWWTRITNYITTTSVQVSEATAKIEAENPAKEVLGGLTGGVELKLALKESNTFRQNLRAFLDNRLGQLKKEVNRFIEEGVQALRARYGAETRIVFIFDQLEQISGSLSNEREVIASIERLFAVHLEKLRLPLVHALYTVPPWLPILLPGQEIELLPCLRLWDKDPARTHIQPVWTAVRHLMERRLEKQGFARLFGGGLSAADPLIEASGGQFRDLLRLMREVLVRVSTQTETLPASKLVIEEAIQRIREQYLPISEEDAVQLSSIAEHRGSGLRNSTPEEVSRTSRLLNQHLVLYFSNGGDYYDIHPLIRDEVQKIVKRLNAKE